MPTAEKPPDNQYTSRYEQQSFQPIFIMGVQRSGTSILYKILNETNNFNIVRAYHLIKFPELIFNHIHKKEKDVTQHLTTILTQNAQQDRGIDRLEVTPLFPEEYGFLLSQLTKKSYLTEDGVPYLKGLCQKIQFISNNNKPILLKNPFDFSNFVFIQKIFPHAKFIFIHRNPLKTLNSQLNATRTLLKHKSTYMALLSPGYDQLFEHKILLAYYRFLYSDKTPLRLRSAVKNLQHHCTQLILEIPKIPQANYFNITYEELCSHPNKSIEDIMKFLEVDIQNTPTYAHLIAPRKTKWLPEISKNKERILNKFHQYLDYCGYSDNNLMQV